MKKIKPFCMWTLAAAVPAAVGLAVAGGDTVAVDSAVTSPWDFVVKDINGNEVDLAQYRGQVAIIVNVASKCGFTPQYAQLEALYEENKSRGFAVLGFPANNFLWQEPGSDKEIQTFCTTKYNVTFDMFSKISVKGDDIAPLYAFLTSKKANGEFGGKIAWNFTKFLVNREGRVIARFGPRTAPDAPEVKEAIEAALAAPVPEKE